MNMESNSEAESLKEDRLFFKTLVKKHINLTVVLILVITIFFALAMFLAVWWVENSHYGGYGAWTFNDWNFMNLTFFIVYLVGIELVVFIILGAILFIVLYFGVYVKLPEEEKTIFKWKKTEEEKEEEKQRWKRRTERWGGKKTQNGGFGFFIFLVFLAFLFIEGNIETNIGDLSYSYWFFAWLKSMAVMGIVAFVGFGIYFLWLLRQPD